MLEDIAGETRLLRACPVRVYSEGSLRDRVKLNAGLEVRVQCAQKAFPCDGEVLRVGRVDPQVLLFHGWVCQNCGHLIAKQ